MSMRSYRKSNALHRDYPIANYPTVHIPGSNNLPPGISHQLAYELAYVRPDWNSLVSPIVESMYPGLVKAEDRRFHSPIPNRKTSEYSMSPTTSVASGGEHLTETFQQYSGLGEDLQKYCDNRLSPQKIRTASEQEPLLHARTRSEKASTTVKKHTAIVRDQMSFTSHIPERALTPDRPFAQHAYLPSTPPKKIQTFDIASPLERKRNSRFESQDDHLDHFLTGISPLRK